MANKKEIQYNYVKYAERSIPLSELDSVRSRKFCFNNFATSFGIIVTTADNYTVVIRRRIPYCTQNFFHQYLPKHRKVSAGETCSFESVQGLFETEYLPLLPQHDQDDYDRFLSGQYFEDEYDFPHGQITLDEYKYIFDKTIRRNSDFAVPPSRSKQAAEKKKFRLFLVAYREFKEETGFHFSFRYKDIVDDRKTPMISLSFRGFNRKWYEQFYFHVHLDSRKQLKKKTMNFKDYDCHITKTSRMKLLETATASRWDDDRLVFMGYLVRIEEAYKLLKRQQLFKQDGKHFMLSDEFWKLKRDERVQFSNQAMNIRAIVTKIKCC